MDTQYRNEEEKMLAGVLYDPAKDGLPGKRTRAHDLCREYNMLSETEERREEILRELFPHAGENLFIYGPMIFDYGEYTSFGDNVFINFNFTCIDCAPVTIGNDVFFGPNVSILTPVHPMRYQERNMFRNDEGNISDLEYARPISIGDNCWIAGNVTICGGVTIGNGCVIGAGSVVTRDIPDNTFAAGVPCRPVREITEKDAMDLKYGMS
ncbi:MAG: sugar O-acetyltransferase [Lachnospiraceae bacterium]|nr:sugar O-acetyltransferase [Lachnospiraceae bacterium]